MSENSSLVNRLSILMMVFLLPGFWDLQPSEHVLIEPQFLSHFALGVISRPQVKHGFGERSERQMESFEAELLELCWGLVEDWSSSSDFCSKSRSRCFLDSLGGMTVEVDLNRKDGWETMEDWSCFFLNSWNSSEIRGYLIDWEKV